MPKIVGLAASIILLNSVLVPLTANATTVATSSVITNSEATSSMTTTETVQNLATAPQSYTVTLTAYNAVPDQTSPTPWVTASGAPSNPEVVAARSAGLASDLPYGTIIAVYGPTSSDDGPYCGYDSVSNLIGYRVIADSMNSRWIRPRIDVMLPTSANVNGEYTNPAKTLGACTGVQVQVVGYVDPNDIPPTQEALADLVNHDQELAYKTF